MKISRFDKLMLWGMDTLSFLGAKPYTSISWKLMIYMLFIGSLPPFFCLLGMIFICLFFSKKILIRGKRWPWYVLGSLPLVVYLTSNQLMALWDLVGLATLLFLGTTITGVCFNKWIVPQLVKAIAEMQSYTEETESDPK